MAFEDVATRVFALYGSRDYREALTVVQNARREYPEEDNDLTFWEACLLARIDRPQDALAVLAGGVDRGQWWGPGRLADPDLDPVRPLGGWDRVARRCAEITQERMAHRPPPVIRTTANPAGTIVAIQGAHAHQQALASMWEAATPSSWTVITPAGAEPSAPGSWAWPRSLEDSAKSVKRDIKGLALDRPVVLTGFSIGSAIACHLITRQGLPVDGLIAVAPSSPSSFDELRTVANTGIPSLIICGAEDISAGQYKQLQTDIGDRPNVTIDIVEGLGHANPPDLEERVTRFLEALHQKRVTQ
ncbi:MAG: alpha/beta hydrolase [Acidimicrobiia bacterium]